MEVDSDSGEIEVDSAFSIPFGSVRNTVLARGLAPPAFNKEKPGYSQVTELFTTVMAGVGQNPILLEEVYNLLATKVAAPISSMINQLDALAHGDNGNGGIAEFSSVDEMNPARSKRFKAMHELQLGGK